MDVQRQFLVKTLDGFHLGHHTSSTAKKITLLLEHQTSQKAVVLNPKISVMRVPSICSFQPLSQEVRCDQQY